LRQVFVFLNMHAVNRPEVMISSAAERFDEQGNLKDENTRKHIRNLLETLVEWARQLERGKRTGAAAPKHTLGTAQI
jgi:chromate reductase